MRGRPRRPATGKSGLKRAVGVAIANVDESRVNVASVAAVYKQRFGDNLWISPACDAIAEEIHPLPLIEAVLL